MALQEKSLSFSGVNSVIIDDNNTFPIDNKDNNINYSDILKEQVADEEYELINATLKEYPDFNKASADLSEYSISNPHGTLSGWLIKKLKQHKNNDPMAQKIKELKNVAHEMEKTLSYFKK